MDAIDRSIAKAGTDLLDHLLHACTMLVLESVPDAKICLGSRRGNWATNE